MRQYEITYLISDEVGEADLNKVTGKVNGFIGELGGKVIKEEAWGRRKLVYPIKKQNFATYVTATFNLPGDKVTALEQLLKHYNNVIRHLLIVRNYGTEELSLTAEEIAETEDIAEVVGGERSFEAIEGETEESIELHSKRKEDESNSAEASLDKEEKEEEIEAKPEKAPKAKSKKTEESDSTEASLDKEATEETEEAAEVEEVKVEKKSKKAKIKTEERPESNSAKASLDKEEKAKKEAERLSKLDKELDDILGDDL